MSRSPLLPLCLAPILALGSAGCSSSLTVTRYAPDQDLQGAGVVYFLPKTELQLRFNVELTSRPGESCARILDDCESLVEPGDLRLTGVELIGVTLPDDQAGFVLESRGTVVTETDFTATLDEVGQLLSTNAVTSDNTIETLTWGVDTLSKVFQTAVMAGASDLKATQQLAVRRDLLLKAIRLTNESVAASLDAGDVGEALAAKPIMEALYDQLGEIEAQLNEVLTLPVVCSIDPSSAFIEELGEERARIFVIDPLKPLVCPEYAFLKGWLDGAGLSYVPPLPTLRVRMIPRASLETRYTPDDQWYRLTQSAGISGTGTVPGLVYRVPAWFEVSVLSDQGPLLKETLAVPQLGRLAALTVSAEAMRKNRTLQVTLHPGLGSIQEVHYALSPVDLEAAQALTDTVINIPLKQAELEGQRTQAEIDRISAQLELMEAQQALADALRAAEEAKAAEAAGADGTPAP